MDKKYKRLISNTALFAVSQFSSRLLFFVMAPLFSYWFESQETNGVRDLLNQLANFAIPLVSLGISNAIIRFGLEKNTNKSHVYTNGILAIAMGSFAFILLSPLIAQIEWYTEYIVLICIYLPVSCLRTLNCQFARAMQKIRIYAIDGILTTVVTCVLYVVLLRNMQLGPTGYLLAVIFADAFSVLFLFIILKLWQFIKLTKASFPLLKRMLAYSLPLVPASIFWWVTNASDQLFVAAMLPNGESWTAIYSASYRLPTILTIVSTIFTEAWQISAVTENDTKTRGKFFSNIFKAYQGVMFVCGAGLILIAQPFMLLYRSDYFIGWTFIPFLVIATIFSSLSNFLNSIYMVEKRSMLSLFTMMSAAVVNCILNFILIPILGVNGAVIATLVSYLLVFILRIISTRKLIPMNFSLNIVVINTLLLTVQAFITLYEITFWPVFSFLICVALFAFNIKSLWSTFKNIIKRKK